jgi:hypothetical protein
MLFSPDASGAAPRPAGKRPVERDGASTHALTARRPAQARAALRCASRRQSVRWYIAATRMLCAFSYHLFASAITTAYSDSPPMKLSSSDSDWRTNVHLTRSVRCAQLLNSCSESAEIELRAKHLSIVHMLVRMRLAERDTACRHLSCQLSGASTHAAERSLRVEKMMSA